MSGLISKILKDFLLGMVGAFVEKLIKPFFKKMKLKSKIKKKTKDNDKKVEAFKNANTKQDAEDSFFNMP